MKIQNRDSILVTCSILLFLSLWLYLFQNTLASTVNTWNTSDTYGHGYLIPLLSLYFIWLKRFELRATIIQPCYWAIVPIIGLCLFWLIGELSYTNVIKQFAVFLFPLFFVLFMFGWKVSKVIVFPLIFLIFCVPFGEGLIPLLQVITAEITIYFIGVIGIPVYVDGLFITLTSGVFEVAKACSGISYLISSLAIGSFYAFISYNSPKHRAYFIFFSLLVPIIANGLRALLIVLLAHYSDLAIATGFDHLIYGWVFFGVILFIMFSVGARWADNNVFKDENWLKEQKRPEQYKNIFAAFLVFIIPLILVKFYSQSIDSIADKQWSNAKIIQHSENWQENSLVKGSAISKFSKADKVQYEQFVKNRFSVDFYGAYFEREHEGKEFISYENRIYDINQWALDKSEVIQIGDATFNRYEVVNSTGKRKQIVFSYIVNEESYISRAKVKLAMLQNKVFNHQASALYVAFTSDYTHNSEQEKTEIINFIKEHINQIL